MFQRKAIFWILASLLVLSGCQTFETFGDPAYDGPSIYSGTRRNLTFVGSGVLNLSMFMVSLGVIDFPFSFVADTLLLPVTIPRWNQAGQSKFARERVDQEVASPVQVEPGEAPQEIAERLFAICQKRGEQLDPSLTDCYSIAARIELKRQDEEVRAFSGAEYKPEIRHSIKRASYQGDFMTYRDVSYEVSGETVRIRAMRATAFSRERLPVYFVVGPSADGQWRILEESSPGWP
ncbi:MAG: YceK/YidQ family lipoprotein [bacterium]|nr:YceK/YidQ family lipoprotein [bacterium]